MAESPVPKIHPEWILQSVTLFVSMGSVVFSWGPFEVALGARPITILRIELNKKQSHINKMELRKQIGKIEYLYGELYPYYSLFPI